jgi:hypothetical protein
MSGRAFGVIDESCMFILSGHDFEEGMCSGLSSSESGEMVEMWKLF